MKDDKNKKKDIFRQSICRKEKELMSWIEDIQDREEDFLLDVIDLKTSDLPIRGQRIA